MKKSYLFLLGVLIFGIFLFSLNNVSAVGEVSFCCERTLEGAWCQSVAEESDCDPNYRSPVPSSCESTSYCKLGTCIDSQEGTCLENTPERVCQDNNGVWQDGSPEDIPQCKLGCCLIGDQAAFVTQTRCNRLSSVYGLNINFRTDITNEVECIASATSEEKGACVLDRTLERTCRFLTQTECADLESTSSGDTTVTFHKGFLCSDESLATECGPTERTTCVEDRDEVYFLDSCGNLANIYDASKINDKEYWSKIRERGEICNPDSSNADSASCGNCDYFLGSTCKVYDQSEDATRPSLGNSICRDLSCEYGGEAFQHGETWCADSQGVDENLPGSQYYRLICYNGDVSVESCSAFREETCIQDSVDGFSTAACRANRWEDCLDQGSQRDCENTDKRDCQWLEGQTLQLIKYADNDGNAFVVDEDGRLVKPEVDEDGRVEDSENRVGAACVPLNSPGFDFWEPETETEDLCFLANADCLVKFEKRPFGSWSCKENCGCWEGSKNDGDLDFDWIEQRNNICLNLGDCGSSTNFIGIEGYHNETFFSTETIKP